MENKKMSKEQKLRHEVKQLRETCEILANKQILKSMALSLRQIAQGKGKAILRKNYYKDKEKILIRKHDRDNYRLEKKCNLCGGEDKLEKHQGNPTWNKGTKIRTGNLIRITHKGKRMYEHQKIFCQFHNIDGIPKGYIIHHKDFNESNNEISNLQLMTLSEHAKLHNCLSKEKKWM